MLYSIEVIFDHDGSCQSTLVLSAHSMLCPRGYLRIPWSIFNPPHCFELSCCTYAMLSHFSHVRLCVTPQMAANQASLSLGFSRQEHWSGLPFPSPMHESEVAQSCLTLSDPKDCSLPGSSVHGIFQARVLEWGAIAFSVQIVIVYLK